MSWLFCVSLGACTPWSDVDLDGDGWATADGDCDDGDDAVHPSVADGVGDGIDRNCDGHDGIDADGDGFASYASAGDDCDDTQAAVHPNAVELCNDMDDDCNGTADIGAEDATVYWTDEDGDSYGTEPTLSQCVPPGAGHIDRGGDCDDGRAAVHPGAVEACAFDFNCDEVVSPCVPLSGPVSLSDGLAFNGISSGGQAGWSVSVLGDINDDNVVDFAVGAPGIDTTWIIHGPMAEGRDLTDTVRIVGPTGARAGVSVAPLGDVDDDGVDDLVIGAELDDAGGIDAGAVWLVRGPVSETLSLATAAHQLIGPSPGAHAGHAVVGVRDGDGDGRRDVLIGAWSEGLGGAAYLMPADTVFSANMSSATLAFHGSDAEGAGWSVASGDLDADGLSDAVIGAPFAGAGTTYVSFGQSELPGATVSLSEVDVAIVGEADGHQAGWALSVGDVDGDGTDDLWLSAPLAHESGGGAWLFYGGPVPWAAQIAAAEADSVLVGTDAEGLGQSLAIVPDVDGDGGGELLISGLNGGGMVENGVVWLFSGAPTAVLGSDTATAVLWGEQDQDRLGAGMAAGDVNGDGRGDILLGAPGAGDSGEGSGAALLFWGG